MIVIATNNGMDFLPVLLKSIEKFGRDNHQILIVDTGSTDNDFREYVDRLRTDYLVSRINGGRDSGAYWHAYDNYDDGNGYMFMHDSMEARGEDWLTQFTDKKKDFVCYAWFNVAANQCPIPENIAKQSKFGIGEKGIFGPIFYATRKFMGDVDKSGSRLIPLNREETHATERLWGGIVEGLGYEIESVYGEYDHEASKKGRSLIKKYPIRP